MEWITFGAIALLLCASYALGKYDKDTNLKRENERLNAELRRLTDRDAKGRFVKREKK